MKKLITAILILAAFQGIAQRKTVILSETKVGYRIFEKGLYIDLEAKDTIKYVYVAFKNDKYKTINDVKSFAFYDKESFDKFKDDMRMSYSEMDKGSNVNWIREEYTITVYDFNNTVNLFDKNMLGKSQIYKKEVEKILHWLDSIEF